MDKTSTHPLTHFGAVPPPRPITVAVCVSQKQELMSTSLRTAKPLGSMKLPTRPEHGSSLRVAFQQIREMIVHGRLSPGTWIVEANLANHLGMSRTPLRGAIHGLQREGFIVEHKGANKSRMVVAPLTSEDAEELYAIIGSIEGLVGRRIATLAKDNRVSLCSRLQEANEQLRSIKRSGISRAGEIFDIDRGFHNMIIKVGAGPRLRSLHAAVEPQAERYWRLYASSILEDLDSSINEHVSIIRTIDKGVPDDVETALRQSWVNGWKRLGKLIHQFGEKGSW